MNEQKFLIAAVLAIFFSMPAPAQENGGPADGHSGVAAFDYGWLAAYYGLGSHDAASVAEDGALASEDGEAEPAREKLSGLHGGPYMFSLRANLLRWATLTPDIGAEWRVTRSVGILIHGTYGSWSWNDSAGRYALWEVAPEVRWYLGKEKRGYLGIMYKAGSFNYKLSETGRQGDIMGAAVTGGYRLRLTDALSLDFSLGLGYVRADFETYGVHDGVRVRSGAEARNWLGPVNAGVTLSWDIF